MKKYLILYNLNMMEKETDLIVFIIILMFPMLLIVLVPIDILQALIRYFMNR